MCYGVLNMFRSKNCETNPFDTSLRFERKNGAGATADAIDVCMQCFSAYLSKNGSIIVVWIDIQKDTESFLGSLTCTQAYIRRPNFSVGCLRINSRAQLKSEA